jgi:hypothetical protein
LGQSSAGPQIQSAVKPAHSKFGTSSLEPVNFLLTPLKDGRKLPGVRKDVCGFELRLLLR